MSTTGRVRPFFTYTGGRVMTEQTDNDCREMSEERERAAAHQNVTVG